MCIRDREKISRAQYQQYLDREICFSAEGMRFSVKNIAREYLLRIIDVYKRQLLHG